MLFRSGEWLIHKHLLHGVGRRRGSFFAFHWREHHHAARLHGMRDEAYERSVLGWHGQGKEALLLTVATAAHLPLLPIAPFFTGTVTYSAIRYYVLHRRSHLDPQWAREHLPWHYDHHMARDQDANWCVTHPLFDHVVGTRVPYVGTEAERADRARVAASRARRAAAAA